MAAHVPNIRAQCERLTLEVKGMLIMNDVPGECITIGILKNKDLEGNDILSQVIIKIILISTGHNLIINFFSTIITCLFFLECEQQQKK